MNQINIISDLIKWIEKNLEQPLSIDAVAEKSGYSKWHLQRMFKKVTGQILGTYIRHRRLTHAALALRLTSKPILDIAMQYRFDSQQTFTRSFKRQFNVTPATYRRNDLWNPAGLTPPIELQKIQISLPEPTFANFPEQEFWGITYKNNCDLNTLINKNTELRKQFFNDYLAKTFNNKRTLPDKIYSFSRLVKSKDKDNQDEQELLYSIAIEEQNISENTKKFVSSGGLYLCFKYVGSPANFIDFMNHVYFSAIPRLNVQLRRAEVIEIYRNHDNVSRLGNITEINVLDCDYCIPIVSLD